MSLLLDLLGLCIHEIVAKAAKPQTFPFCRGDLNPGIVLGAAGVLALGAVIYALTQV